MEHVQNEGFSRSLSGGLSQHSVLSASDSSSVVDGPMRSYPDIPESPTLQNEFRQSLQHMTSLNPHRAPPLVESLEKCLTRWHNMCPSISRPLSKLALAFTSWWSLVHVHRVLEQRRLRRSQAAEAKDLLMKPPKKRRPPEVIKLLHYHAENIEKTKDHAGFRSFPALPKKSLQLLYKHIKLYKLKGNTPVFIQGQVDPSYFVILKGGVSIWQAGDSRMKEIYKHLHSTLKDVSKKDLANGFLGKPITTIEIDKSPGDHPAVGFGGLQALEHGRDLWKYSCATTGESEILVCDAKTYKELLYADHEEKYLLAERISRLSRMPTFKGLVYTQVEHLAADFVNESYVRKAVVVERGVPVSRIVVIMSGEVEIVAFVEDPSCPGRKLTVQVVTAGPGTVIGDLELSKGWSKFAHRVVALTEVETAEMETEEFRKHIFNSVHATSTRDSLIKGADSKDMFYCRRVAREMKKFMEHVRQMERDRAKLDKDHGGVDDKIIYVKDEWERQYRAYIAKLKIQTTVMPFYNYEDDLYLKRDISSAQGFRVESRIKKKVFTNSDVLQVASMKIKEVEDPPPYFDRTKLTSAKGGKRSIGDMFTVDLESSSP